MIVQLHPPPGYEEALRKALTAYNIERGTDEYDRFATAFLEGWQSSKKHTISVLDSIEAEGNNNVDE